jgi:hypothetical protein
MYLQGLRTRSAPPKNAYYAIKNALLSNKNCICTFMRCEILIKEYLIHQLSWQIHLSFLPDFCWNKNKNKPKQPLLYSLFQNSKGTSANTETNNTSYESPDTQLFGAKRMRAWQHHGVATPTFSKTVWYFSFLRSWRLRGMNFFN